MQLQDNIDNVKSSINAESCKSSAFYPEHIGWRFSGFSGTSVINVDLVSCVLISVSRVESVMN